MRSKRTLKTESAAAPARRTRDRLVRAALKTLTQRGFTGATARVIAREARVNQALIFYHFGSVDQLLLAALDATSQARLERYRAALKGTTRFAELIEVMTRLYREDILSGHVTAVQELVAGASSAPALRREVLRRMTPWLDFARQVLGRMLTGTVVERMVSIDDLAYAAVAFYFGIETLTNLSADRTRVDALFESGKQLAPVADAILQSATWVGESA